MIKEGEIMDELKKYGSNIYINDYEKSVIEKCNIDVTSCKSIDEVILLLGRYLDEEEIESEEYDEVDYVVSILSERKYYMGNK